MLLAEHFRYTCSSRPRLARSQTSLGWSPPASALDSRMQGGPSPKPWSMGPASRPPRERPGGGGQLPRAAGGVRSQARRTWGLCSFMGWGCGWCFGALPPGPGAGARSIPSLRARGDGLSEGPGLGEELFVSGKTDGVGRCMETCCSGGVCAESWGVGVPPGAVHALLGLLGPRRELRVGTPLLTSEVTSQELLGAGRGPRLGALSAGPVWVGVPGAGGWQGLLRSGLDRQSS